jgi:hypothetical protein
MRLLIILLFLPQLFITYSNMDRYSDLVVISKYEDSTGRWLILSNDGRELKEFKHCDKVSRRVYVTDSIYSFYKINDTIQ